MMKFKIQFYRVVTFLSLKCHLYQINSWIFRWTQRRKMLQYHVSLYASVKALSDVISTLTWKADDWRCQWDAFDYPEAVEYAIRFGEKNVRSMDCDEFAVYIATALQKSIDAGLITNIFNPQILTVVWVDKDGKMGGHNMCVMQFKAGKELFVGYMDYGDPQFFKDYNSMLHSILDLYSPGCTCVGWAVLNKDTLSTMMYYSGL